MEKEESERKEREREREQRVAGPARIQEKDAGSEKKWCWWYTVATHSTHSVPAEKYSNKQEAGSRWMKAVTRDRVMHKAKIDR